MTLQKNNKINRGHQCEEALVSPKRQWHNEDLKTSYIHTEVKSKELERIREGSNNRPFSYIKHCGTVTLQRDNVAMTETVRRVKLLSNFHPVEVL
jgi:hypothetical protein